MPKVEPEWRDVPGWEGLYRVSDDGQVYSIRRQRVLSRRPITGGYGLVALCRDGEREQWLVHRLVLTAFVGPCPEGLEACHRNGVEAGDRLDNLYWGTRADNTWDKIRHGNHPFAQRTACSAGHEYPENVRRTKRGVRICPTCTKRYKANYAQGRT